MIPACHSGTGFVGVDATILIRRVRAGWASDLRLDALSAGLCRDIGRHHFYLREGDALGQVHAAPWTARFSAHPFLSDCLRYGLDESQRERQREVYELILADIGERPHPVQRAIDPSMSWYRESEDPPPGSRYEQDGPTIDADPGEFLLELSLPGRYYGEDYPRGDPVLYAAIADWLEAHIPACEVWYGSDGGLAPSAPFGPARRRSLIEHLRAHDPERPHWRAPASAASDPELDSDRTPAP